LTLHHNPPELIIEADRVERQYWRDLWVYRELLLFLTWRDVLVRYKQTAIGVAWAVIRPLLTVVVFTLVFGRIAKLDSGEVPYPVLVAVGMLPWQFFATALAEGSGSLVNNASLVSKVYFPRLILPTSAVLTSFVDFAITFACTLVLMIALGQWPDLRVLALPVFTFMALGLAVGAGLWLAALNAKYRDFRYIIPFIVQFGLYVSPVGFRSTEVPEKWRFLYALNPMVGVIDGFRWCLLRGASGVYWPGVAFSGVLCFFLLATGILYFRQMERTFADVI
jgi:lipopolysaccharide transport system permease protein